MQIREGASATIENWGGPPLAAVVHRIDPSAVTKVSALGIEEQRVSVVLSLQGKRDEWVALGHGFRVVVRITRWKGEGLTSVPIGALFRQGCNWAAYVVENSTARLRVLETGARNADFAEVKKGLVDGDTIILHPSDRVSGGVAVVARTAD